MVSTPKEAGIFLLNEMCNVYKHRLLAPVLLSFKSVELGVRGVRCSITSFRLHEVNGPLNDDTVFASFASPDFGPESKVSEGEAVLLHRLPTRNPRRGVART